MSHPLVSNRLCPRLALGPGSRLAPSAIRTPFRCEQTDQKPIAMLSDGDLDIRFACNAQQALPDGDWLLGCIQADFENLLGAGELADEALELSLLLLAFPCRRTEFAHYSSALVHESGIGLANGDHFRLSPGSGPMAG